MPSPQFSASLTLARAIDYINHWLGRSVAWLSVFMVLLTCLIVVLRYGFDIGATATQELIMYGHSLAFMGAAAWALQRDAHVRVDIFFRRFSSHGQALIDFSGTLLFLLPMFILLLVASLLLQALSQLIKTLAVIFGALPRHLPISHEEHL